MIISNKSCTCRGKQFALSNQYNFGVKKHIKTTLKENDYKRRRHLAKCSKDGKYTYTLGKQCKGSGYEIR